MQYRQVEEVITSTYTDKSKIKEFANTYGYCLLSHDSPMAVGADECDILLLGLASKGKSRTQARVRLGSITFEPIIGKGLYGGERS